MKLFIVEGQKSGTALELRPPGISIGRELDNDLILDGEGCSRYHAKLDWTDDGWMLKDLGSTNGTKLNGLKIEGSQKLTEGDKIKIGGHVMLYSSTGRSDATIRYREDEKPKPAAAPPESKTLTEEEMSERKKNEEKDSFQNFFRNDKDSEKKADAPKDASFDKIDFFGGRKDDQEGAAKEASGRKHAGGIFYIIVFLAALVLVGVFLLFEKMNSESKAAEKNMKPTEKPLLPLTVLYEKQISSPDNIFRYSLEIKNSKITVTRDDLKHHIRFTRDKELSRESMQELEDSIKQTDFMNLPEQQAGVSSDGTDEIKSLTVAFGTALNSIRIRNTFEPTSFKQVTSVIEDFSNTTLNIPTISLTAEEMKEQAEKAFYKAEQLFANFQANDENLKEALNRYQVVIDLLECFEPKPDMYDKAYQQAQEARRMLDEEIKTLEKDALQHRKLQEFHKAREEYQRIKDKLNSDDKRYQQARDWILKIDKYLNSKKKD